MAMVICIHVRPTKAELNIGPVLIEIQVTAMLDARHWIMSWKVSLEITIMLQIQHEKTKIIGHFFGYFLIKIRKYFVFAVWYVLKKRGSLTHKHLLDANQYVYRCSSKIGDHTEYWRCSDSNNRCLARISLRAGQEPIFTGSHNHASNYDPRTMTILSDDPP